MALGTPRPRILVSSHETTPRLAIVHRRLTRCIQWETLVLPELAGRLDARLYTLLPPQEHLAHRQTRATLLPPRFPFHKLFQLFVESFATPFNAPLWRYPPPNALHINA